MHRLEDRRFERLTALTCVGKTNGGHRLWQCLCDCGTYCVVSANHLVTLHTRSCGCLHRDITRENSKRHITHGRSLLNDSVYRAWHGMKSRCLNKADAGYPNYGGRGIKVCERWRNSFENFLEDMGEKPSPQHSLDRIDVNGDYTPENCRWATRKEQANNKRTSAYLTLGERTQTVSQWAEELSMPRPTLEWRITAGWDSIKALTHPVRKRT